MLLFILILFGLSLGAQTCELIASESDKQVNAGSYKKAEELGAKAVELCREANDKKSEAIGWNSIGLAHVYLGEYDAAVTNYKKALALDQATGSKAYQVRRWNNIGAARYFQGRYQESLSAYQSADQVEKLPLTKANLAVLYQRLGRFEAALALYKDMRGEPGSLSPSEEARALTNQGTLYRRLGDPYKALSLYAQAKELYTKQQHREGQILVEKNSAIARALDLKDYKASLAGFDRLVAQTTAFQDRRELMQAYLYRAEVKSRLNDLDGAGKDWSNARDLAAEIKAPDDEWKALHGMARAATPAKAIEYETEALRMIEGMRLNLASRVLRPEFLADKRDVYDGLISKLAEQPQPPLDRIFELMEQARARMFQDQLRRAVTLPSIKISDIQQHLDDKTALWTYWSHEPEPLRLWITKHSAGLGNFPDQGPDQRIERLWIILDGSQAVKSIDTLLWKPNQMLIERFEIAHLPAAALLINEQPKQNRWLWPWQLQALAFGNPAVGNAALLPGDERWQQLNYSSEETEALPRILPGRVEVRNGLNADKKYLADAAGVRLLHIATHGAANEEEPDRSRLLFAKGEYLFLNEVYNLNLQGVELATLSACETERGRFVKGEGVMSLGRAFLTAGAQSTITTLWRVDDAATAHFMELFYTHLSKGETKAHALRETKLSFLHSGTKWAATEYWAAFVLTGDGFSRLGPTAPIGPILIFAAALFLGYGLMGRARQSR